MASLSLSHTQHGEKERESLLVLQSNYDEELYKEKEREREEKSCWKSGLSRLSIQCEPAEEKERNDG